MSPVRLSILIPVYNEVHSIRSVLQQVISAPAAFFRDQQLNVEIIVVDDGSQDTSSNEVTAFSECHPEAQIRLIHHAENRGKGAAIRTAIAQAKGEICIIQDADFEYDPHDYPKLLKPLLAGEAEVVLGSRFMHGSEYRPLRFWQAVANRAITRFASLAAGLDLSDVETGYKAFRTSLAQTVPLKSDRFGLDPELVIQLAKRHARFIEVPITYRGRTQEQGKKIGVLDLWRAFGTILRTWLLSASHTDPAADMLVAMSRARRFNRWMAESIQPYIRGDVLELGAGIGNLTTLLARSGNHYLATDTDLDHLTELRSRTAYLPNVSPALFDFSNAFDVQQFQNCADTVVCLNVLEHVAEDVIGLRNIRKCLRPGGAAIILVPQSPELFGSFDEVLQHKRRYTQNELKQKMSAAGFTVNQIICFNRVTWPGWYLNSKVLRRRTLSRMQLQFVDFLVPLWRKIDHALPWPSTSIIAIGLATHAAE